MLRIESILILINLLLIGTGAWGQRYIQTLRDFPDVRLTTAGSDNWQQAIDNKPDGVIVCTPPESHIRIASYALDKDIPCMIEKPLALSVEEANQLSKYQAPILVNHIHLFSEVFYRNVIDPNKIKRIQSTGFGPGPIRKSYSSLWDYGPHDIAMILYLTGGLPKSIKIQETKKNDFQSVYFIVMNFVIFNTYSVIGNGASFKSRTFSVGHDDGIFDYNGLIDQPSPLRNAINVFLDSISGKPDRRLGLQLSIDVLTVLEECQTLLNSR